MKRLLRSALPWLLLVYGAVAVISIWPASIDPSHRIVGGGELGGWLWRYWWMKLEIRALWEEMHGYPLQFFLHVISLGRFPETGNITDLYAVSLPLDLLFGAPTYYNVKVMLIVVTNGLAGYALSRSFTASRWVAAAAGTVLAMNSFVALELFGSGLRQAILAPFAMAVVSLEGLLARGRLRDGLATGLWFACTAVFYWFYGLFLFLYAVLRGMVALPSVWRSARRWWIFATLVEAAAIAVAVAAVFAYPYVMFKLDHSGALPEVQYLTDFPDLDTLEAATDYPRTLEENLLASLKRVLHSSWSLDYLWNPLHPRNVPVVAFVVGVVGALFQLRRAGVFLVALLFFWLHTGGPYLLQPFTPDASGFVRVDGEPVPLLYAWTFKFVPLMSRLFAPYRAAGPVWVMMTALVALGLDGIWRRWGTRASTEGTAGADEGGEEALTEGPARVVTRPWLAPLVAVAFGGLFLGQQVWDDRVLALLEPSYAGTNGRGLPVMTSEVKTHPFYEALAQEEGYLGIIELPMFVQQDLITYYQVIHGKKVLEGWAMPGALPPYLRFVQQPRGETAKLLQFLAEPDAQRANSFIKAMSLLSRPPYKLQDYTPSDIETLANRGFRYVILHERGCYAVWPEEGQALYDAMKRRIGRELGTPAEVIEFAEEDDPAWERLRPHVGVVGSWASSALPIPGKRPTRFRMAVFLMPGAGWGEAWLDAVAWPDRLRPSPAEAPSSALPAEAPSAVSPPQAPAEASGVASPAPTTPPATEAPVATAAPTLAPPPAPAVAPAFGPAPPPPVEAPVAGPQPLNPPPPGPAAAPSPTPRP